MAKGAQGRRPSAGTLCTAGAAALAIACVLVWPVASASAAQSQSFGYTGGEQDWTVPAGVTAVTIQASGAQGGGGYFSAGGDGGSVTATIPVTPGETLAIFVGGQGGGEDSLGGGDGGFNGGAGGAYGDWGGGGGGGGGTDVRQGGTGLGDRVVVAGGGGGGGGSTRSFGGAGGAGGGTTGATGGGCQESGSGGGGGGTQTGGGGGGDASGAGLLCYPGEPGDLGLGGAASSYDGGGGGGGGGYFGGGGGSAGVNTGQIGSGGGGGGGGGSSFTESDATDVSNTQGGWTGNGEVVIDYKANSTTSVESSLNPSLSGQSVTFTATVTGAIPSGTVEFEDSATDITGCGSQPLSNGNATCTTSSLSAGSHTITANYSGDSSNNASTSPPITQTVIAATSIGSLAGFVSAGGSPFAAGTIPNGTAVGDLNGDGHPDIVTANYGSGDVTVLLGDGHGGFAPAIGSPFAAGGGPSSIAIADLNGDGHPDLAVSDWDSGTVTVLLGDGHGGFTPASGSPFAAGAEPNAVAVGDLNGDGHPDIVVGNYGSNDVTVLLGDGHGGFTAAAGSPFATGSNPYSVAIADLNGDGNPDVAVADDGSGDVTVLLGDGHGGLTADAGSPFAAGNGPVSVAVGDLNGDGHPDIAAADWSSGAVTVLVGDGHGGFSPGDGSPLAVGSEPRSVAIADLNGNGRPDLVVADAGSDDVTVLLGGTGGFAAAPGSPFAVGNTPYSVAVADFDGDGHPDLAVADRQSNDVTVLLQVGTPGPPPSVTAAAGNGRAIVSWSAPVADGHSPIDAYTVTADPGGQSCRTDGSGRSCTVTALTNGTPYTFTVVATNGVGIGTASDPSAAVTPEAPGAPTVTSFSPMSGGIGTTVTLTGTNLGGATSVKLGSSNAPFTPVSATTLTFTVPVGARSGRILVTAPGGTASSASTFDVTVPPPAVYGFSPQQAAVGATVTITGARFSGATRVTFNGVPATLMTAVSDGTVTAVVPVGATSGQVAVTTPYGTARSTTSLVVLPAVSPAPAITSFAPMAGIRGFAVVIRGSGFIGVTGVSFNGTHALFQVLDDHTIRAYVPSGATSGPLTVTTPGGVATSAGSFTVIR